MSGTGESLVGVVVAAYQAERHLGHALESVAGQTHQRWVAVVVDDGSTDATAAVAGAFAARDGRFCVLRQANTGVSGARNAGLAALPAEAEYVCFLDSDDVLLPDALATLTATLEDRPDAPGASGWAERVDDDGAPVEAGVQRALQSQRPVGAGLRCRILGPGEDTTFETLLLHGSVSPPATALVRRAVAERVGGFAAELTCHEDGDFWVRVARTGPLVFVDTQIAWYRRHRANATGQTATCLRMAYVMRRRAWTSPDNTPAQRRAVLRAGLRTRSWELARAGRRVREAARNRRPAAVGWGVARALAAVAEMAAVRPVVPPRWWTDLAVRMDEKCGFDPSGRW